MNLEQKDELYRRVYRAAILKSGETAAAAANAAVKIVSEAEEQSTPIPFMKIPSDTYLRILTTEDIKKMVEETVEEIVEEACDQIWD